MLMNQSRTGSMDAFDGTAATDPEARRGNGLHHTRPRLGHPRARDANRGTRPQHTGPKATSRRASWTLSPGVSSAFEARLLVCAQLAGWELGGQSGIAELLVSELVTNTLRHASGRPTLTLRVQEGTLRCEVEATHPTPLPASRAHDRDAHGLDEDGETGHGLQLVDRLSDRWGSATSLAGKVVWFELPAHPSRRRPE